MTVLNLLYVFREATQQGWRKYSSWPLLYGSKHHSKYWGCLWERNSETGYVIFSYQNFWPRISKCTCFGEGGAKEKSDPCFLGKRRIFSKSLNFKRAAKWIYVLNTVEPWWLVRFWDGPKLVRLVRWSLYQGDLGMYCGHRGTNRMGFKMLND